MYIPASLIASNDIALLFDFVAVHLNSFLFALLFDYISPSLVALHVIVFLDGLGVLILVPDADDNFHGDCSGGGYKDNDQCDNGCFRHRKMG